MVLVVYMIGKFIAIALNYRINGLQLCAQVWIY